MTRATLSLAALGCLIGSPVLAQGHHVGSAAAANVTPYNQNNLYLSDPILRFNNPTNQTSLYYNDPILRFNNPYNQAGSFNGAVAGNIPYGYTPPANSPTTGQIPGNGNSTARVNAARTALGLPAGGAVNGSVGGSTPYGGAYAVSGGYGSMSGWSMNGLGLGGLGGFGGYPGAFNNSGMGQGNGMPMMGGMAGLNNGFNGNGNGNANANNGLIGGTELDPDSLSVLDGTNGAARSKSKAKKSTAKKKVTSKKRTR